MNRRKITGIVFMAIAVVLGVLYFTTVELPASLEGYFKKEYYNQYGPLAISIELLVAGFYLFKKHRKANFTLALFGFTALLDSIFNLSGLFTSMVPLYATVIFSLCAVAALWLAFTNTFDLGKISLLGALMGFVLGNAIELYFNYF